MLLRLFLLCTCLASIAQLGTAKEKPRSLHRGLLHHQSIVVTSVSASHPFYEAVFTYLGYELVGSKYGDDYEFEDWKPWRIDTPHEISIVKADPKYAAQKHQKGAVGNHHHMAFCAESREDVDRFYNEVLVPLEKAGHCTIQDPPVDCPEYGEGYYATFFFDPDGLKYEFVINPNYLLKKAERDQKKAK
tara:strand:+ start:468 stop:1034 length:567 start_codon:yes stop_codon:yes gene_type:complete